jgi:hypothetical protein
MQHVGGNELTVRVQLMSEPCLWQWQIRDRGRDEVVADSWSGEWMAYESADEAYRAAEVRLAAITHP